MTPLVAAGAAALRWASGALHFLFRTPQRALVTGLVLACLALGAGCYDLHRQAAAEAEARALAEARLSAAQDTTRLLSAELDGATGEVRRLAAREAYPDIDSVLAAVSDQARRAAEAAGRDLRRELVSAVEVAVRPDPGETSGTADADPPTAPGSSADTLRFSVSDRAGAYDVDADLVVDAAERSLDYTFRVTPDLQRFRFYELERDGRTEVWVEAPGAVEDVRAYVVPRGTATGAAPERSWSAVADARVLAGPWGAYGAAVAGPEVRADLGPLELSATVQAGVAAHAGPDGWRSGWAVGAGVRAGL